MRTPDTAGTGRGWARAKARPWPRLFCLLPTASCLLLTGCRTNPRYELIEAELRTRTRELEQARAELAHRRLLTEAYQHAAPPACLPPAGGVPALPLKDIALGTGTGGVDDDGCPGDEALQVVIVPRDDDGSAVKVPGRVSVEAFEVARSGVKTPIGRWDVPPETLRRTWRGGLFATGYYLPLQWDRPPATDRVRVAARLTTLDGRVYEADRDVTVRPLPGLSPPGPPPGAGLPPPIPPPTGPEELPPPRVNESRRPAVRVAPARPADGIGS